MYNNDTPVTNSPAPSIQDTPESVMNLEWVATRIDAIIKDSEHINSALSKVPMVEGMAASAIAEVVAAREATNQQALKFLEKVYSDLVPANPVPQLPQIDFNHLADYLESSDVVDLIKTLYSK